MALTRPLCTQPKCSTADYFVLAHFLIRNQAQNGTWEHKISSGCWWNPEDIAVQARLAVVCVSCMGARTSLP